MKMAAQLTIIPLIGIIHLKIAEINDEDNEPDCGLREGLRLELEYVPRRFYIPMSACDQSAGDLFV